MGFIPLRVLEVYKVDAQPDVQGTCGPLDYTGPVANGTQIDLADLGAGRGCFELPIEAINSLQVKRLGWGGPDLTSYTFDPYTHTLTWTGAPQPGLGIKFHWVKSGSATCGQ